MIGALKGKIFSAAENPILFFVGGVGYSVTIPSHNLSRIHKDQEMFLYVHTHVREDVFELFGFLDKEELTLFKHLLTVSGIGPKTAMAVMDKGASAIRTAIKVSDVDFFTTIPRLGKKNAQRIIIELKSKLGSTHDLDLSENTSSETKELMEALFSMNFKKEEVVEAIKMLPSDITVLKEKIRYCLKNLGKRV